MRTHNNPVTTHSLRENTLEENLHNEWWIGEHNLYDLGFFSYCGSDFSEEFPKPLLGFWWC